MRLTVGHKLFLSVLAVSLLVIGLVVGLTTWNLRQGFSTYLAQAELSRQNDLVKRLEELYAARGNWTVFREDPAAWIRFIHPERVPDYVAPQPSTPSSGMEANRRVPQSAFDDCRGKQEGDEVWHRTRDGILRSICSMSPDGLVARPIRSLQGQGRSGGSEPGPSPSGGQRASPPLQRPTPEPADSPEILAARRYVLMDRDGRYLAGMRAGTNDLLVTRVLMNEQRPIGQLGLVVTSAASAMDKSFVDHSIQMVLIVAVLALIVSMLAAILLARHFTSTLRQVTLGTRRLASGEYAARIPGDRRDEFGDLVRDFNRLAHALEQHENNRRLWVAQTSHELRTPLSILRAHIEALIDEVRPPSRAEFEVLHRETLRLTKLVGDLNDLARADSGALAFTKVDVELIGLIDELIAAFSDRLAARSLRIERAYSKPAVIFGDASRLRQLFANIFENALRYTDPGGLIRIETKILGGSVEICIDDTAPGVEFSALASLFDPFFRTDRSRQRETGGSGLGLAICKSIVTAHDGSIEAFASDLGGLKLRLVLPLLEQRK